MRFNSLEDMRTRLPEIVVEETIPVSQEELNWYKNRLDGLSLEQRMRAGNYLLTPYFQGYPLVVKQHGKRG